MKIEIPCFGTFAPLKILIDRKISVEMFGRNTSCYVEW